MWLPTSCQTTSFNFRFCNFSSGCDARNEPITYRIVLDLEYEDDQYHLPHPARIYPVPSPFILGIPRLSHSTVGTAGQLLCSFRHEWNQVYTRAWRV
jgi:hypothetical protein